MKTLFSHLNTGGRLRRAMMLAAIALAAHFAAAGAQNSTAGEQNTNPAADGKKIVAYVTSWSSIMPDPAVMTHINYAFGGVGSDYRSVYVDNPIRLRKLARLKEQNPDLKVLLSIGGWGRGNFTPMAKDADNRLAFAKACRECCEKNDIDGIDIDWEYPGNNSSNEAAAAGEKENYTLLLRDLREALGSDYLLTMASCADPGYYDYRSCVQYLDFVNVMSYDMSGPPNHHSALWRGGTVGNGWLTMSEAMMKHLNAGIPKAKLVLGLAFYGNSGQGSQISLQEIEDGIASGKWEDHWDDVAKVPYVTDASGKFAYGYDNARSLSIKCQYIKDVGLAGGMYWEYANDNLAGTERTTVYECLRGDAKDDPAAIDPVTTAPTAEERQGGEEPFSGMTYNLAGQRVAANATAAAKGGTSAVVIENRKKCIR